MTRKQFEEALHETNVFLTNEDIRYVLDKFGKNGHVDYERMSRDMGLHRDSLNLMKTTHTKINRLKSANLIGTGKRHNRDTPLKM